MGEIDLSRRPFEACNIPLFDPENELMAEPKDCIARLRMSQVPIKVH